MVNGEYREIPPFAGQAVRQGNFKGHHLSPLTFNVFRLN